MLAHRAMSCTGYSRSDFIVSAEGPDLISRPTRCPGLTKSSLYPKALKAEGHQSSSTSCAAWSSSPGLSVRIKLQDSRLTAEPAKWPVLEPQNRSRHRGINASHAWAKRIPR